MSNWIRFFLFSCMLVAGPVLAGQTLQGSNPTPAAFLAVATQSNGLDSADVHPWHLKANYQTYDEHGQQKDSGIYEEWWAGPKKDKRSFTSKTFTQTEYVTETGTYRVGEHGFLPPQESLLRPRLISPIPPAPEYAYLQRHTRRFGTIELDCVAFAVKMQNLSAAPPGLFPTYCFDADKPVLRWGGSYGQRNSLYNKIVSFQGRFVATDLQITEDTATPVLSVQVVGPESIKVIREEDFTPTDNAFHVPEAVPVHLAEYVPRGQLIKKTPPAYPQSDRQNRVQGKVVMHAEIGTDGHVHEMTLKEAPDPSLAISAMVAVKQWEYKPYLLNGNPVQVETEINVVYSLGH